ncbi:MAG TPA: DUF87 domain-containing protein [Dissulfurispiraceae bacterium]|nr:DUF87 domain-containing protein [Dissulfurispiraceae bacterium]
MATTKTGVAMVRSNEIGRVVAVHGSYVKIELDSEHRSPVRAHLDGAQTQIRINAYVTFDIGPDESLLGIITDLDSHETFEPSSEELTLELVRPRRLASIQLLGTLKLRSKHGMSAYEFDPGVNLLPTLETLAIPARAEILEQVLGKAPCRNRPSNWRGESDSCEYDAALRLGAATAEPDKPVCSSFNDLFSRPMAVVGNTGSGKSCTIARLIQGATKKTPNFKRVRVFVLDLNGEYASAFGVNNPTAGRQPDSMYANGVEFGIPVWTMNAAEVCEWLSTAEQTQQPALVNLWAIAKGAKKSADAPGEDYRSAVQNLCIIEQLIESPSGNKKGVESKECWAAATAFAPSLKETDEGKSIENILAQVNPSVFTPLFGRSFGASEPTLKKSVATLLEQLRVKAGALPTVIEQTADKPEYFDVSILDSPSGLECAAELSPGDKTMRQFLAGLQLRIQNRRKDKRWQSFYNYDRLQPAVKNAGEWFGYLGIGKADVPSVTVIDCSMLAHEVLPYACGIVGRMLLEVREQMDASKRFEEPWVIVLEEAHNYIRPHRQDEPRGTKVSRETFERIAKEGRKFGLSLIVASQRPSEISPTVLSHWTVPCSGLSSWRDSQPVSRSILV